MEIEAVVWYWTPNGMERSPKGSQERYVHVSEVERLLGDAHRRGKEAGRMEGLEDSKDVVRRTPIRPG